MRKLFGVRLTTLLSVLCILGIYQYVTVLRSNAEETARQEYEQTLAQSTASSAAASYKDGTYTGEGQGFGGPIDVEVTVTDGKIADITVTSHAGEDDTYYSMGQEIIQDILDAQSTDVDTISGATFSSTGIRTAVEAALEEAQ